MIFQHLLVPLDGSARAEQALPVAARVARASGGILTVYRVVPSLIDLHGHAVVVAKRPDQALQESLTQAKDYLTQVASSPDLEGIKVQTEVLTGHPHR